MKIKTTLLLGVLVVAGLASCGEKTYNLKFHQDEGNKDDIMQVIEGKTTNAEAKAFQDKIVINPRKGYDITWDRYDVTTMKADYTVNAVYKLHNYTITYMNGQELVGTAQYNVEMKKSDIKEPKLPTQEHYSFKYEDYSIEGKAEDFTVNTVKTAVEYVATFKDNADDPNPTQIKFTIENPKFNAPAIEPEELCESIDWFDGEQHVSAGAQIDMTLNCASKTWTKYRVGKEFTVTFNKNGGTLEATSQKVRYAADYELPEPTFKSGTADFLGWFDAETGKQIPTSGVSAIGKDITVIARYGAKFETEASKNIIINGSRNCVGSKALDTDSKTIGNSSLKITTTASTTFSASFDADFLASAFADPNVNAVTFDAKTSAACTKFSYGNSITCPYERDCCASDQPGYGTQTYWKTFSLTREMYNNKPAGQNCLLCTVGGQLPVGGFFWIDNIRPTEKAVDYWGFENSRLVDYQPQSTWYNRTVSFRNFAGQEIFVIGQKDTCTDPYFGFDYEVKSEGNRSIKYHRTGNCWCNLTLMAAVTNVAKVSFDICLSIAYNGNTLKKGNGELLFPTTEVVKANEWKTFTVEAKDFQVDSNNSKVFACFQGSPTFDFWIDNLQITFAE